jgi:hypothetical protein
VRLGAKPFAVGAAAAGLCLSTLGSAWARPMWNAGLESGVCGTGSALGFQQVGWCNAGHADLLWLRERSSDFGLGPSLRLGTARFDDLRLDAGLSLLVPIFESFPLVLEAGPHLRNFGQPGVFGAAFFGLRSFNYYGHYEMAAGLSVSAERSFSAGTPSAIWITARIDGSWLALPAIFLYNALK